MKYDTLTAIAFTATARTRYYAPRIAGAWLYSVAMLGLLVAWLGYRAYESGQLFRTQFERGYFASDVVPDIALPSLPELFTEFDFMATAPNDFDYDELLADSEDVTPLIEALNWQDLRKVGKTLGLSCKNKAALLTAITEETDATKVYEAYSAVMQ